jgi:hypothetical protein
VGVLPADFWNVIADGVDDRDSNSSSFVDHL